MSESEKDTTEETNQNEVSAQAVVKQSPPQNKKRKFEIVVYDIDEREDGTPFYKPAKADPTHPVIIEVSSKSEFDELKQQFADCSQTFKIIREIDPEPRPAVSKQVVSNIDNNANDTANNKSTLKHSSANMNEEIADKPNEIVQELIEKKPIKYYKVGDIQIKDDNGKLYQKQWMRLTDIEASNIRIINDKNNQIVNLNGKHIELKKWILVENSNSDESTDIESNLR